MTHPEMPPRRDTAPTQQLRDNNGMRGTCNSDCTLEEYASLYLEHVGAGEADRYLSNVASDLVQRHTSALFGNVSTLASQVEKAIEEEKVRRATWLKNIYGDFTRMLEKVDGEIAGAQQNI